MTACRFDSETILFDNKSGKWYHPSVVHSILCENPEPKDESDNNAKKEMIRNKQRVNK